VNELEQHLRTLEAPGEQEAEERAWAVVRAAFAEREPVRRPARRLRFVLVPAVVAALVAAAFTAPVRAVIDELREAIGVEQAEPALFSLPTHGRLLVESDEGVWVVRADGAKRLFPGYREASWSPFGAFVVATRRHELIALDPDASPDRRTRWTLPRRNVRFPRWSGTRTDTRIAYLSGRTIRVVAGDGTDDGLLARRALAIAPAWRPGVTHELAFAGAAGRVRIVEADTKRLLGSWVPAKGRRALDRPRGLVWSHDGRRLLVLLSRSYAVVTARGRLLRHRAFPRGGASPVAGVFAPRGRGLALVVRTAGGSELLVDGRRVFTGPGRFAALEWSPDRRWLLVAWRDADQWVFIPLARSRRTRAVAQISRQFESERFPTLAGWCCP
jgi:hypothetical protein